MNDKSRTNYEGQAEEIVNKWTSKHWYQWDTLRSLIATALEQEHKKGDQSGFERGVEENEIVICAAVKLVDGLIIRGHRHGDCINNLRKRPDMTNDRYEGHIQGFITSKNRFVTREEGRILQDKAGIKSADKEGYRGKTLFSEDLY